jgi:hypothetical protein
VTGERGLNLPSRCLKFALKGHSSQSNFLGAKVERKTGILKKVQRFLAHHFIQSKMFSCLVFHLEEI